MQTSQCYVLHSTCGCVDTVFLSKKRYAYAIFRLRSLLHRLKNGEKPCPKLLRRESLTVFAGSWKRPQIVSVLLCGTFLVKQYNH